MSVQRDDAWLAEQFEMHRPRLQALAARILGSPEEAEDAVQSAWLKVARAETSGIENLPGWFTTVVSRNALDVLRARRARPETSPLPELEPASTAAPNPEARALKTASVGAALSIVLDSLTPAERLAFVLQDIFGLSFLDIGQVLDRSSQAAKQLALRARSKLRRVDSASERLPPERPVVEAFLAAAREGNLAGLIAVLHPEAALRADAAAVRMGSPAEVVGAEAVARIFSGRALGARVAHFEEGPGLVWLVAGAPRVAWEFIVVDGVITHIEMIAAPDSLGAMPFEVF